MKSLKSELQDKMDFSQIRYSQAWEDHRILTSALRVSADDLVVSITSGGCNALALLLESPKALIAIDISPAQNAYFELKLAAFRHLEYGGLLDLIGVRPSSKKLELLEQLLPKLSRKSSTFFRENKNLVKSGLIGSGRLERFMALFRNSSHIQSLQPQIRGLAEVDCISTQRHKLKEILTEDFRSLFESFFSRENIAKLGRDPAQFEYVDESRDIGDYFWNKFTQAMNTTLFRENFYIQFFLLGEFIDLEYGPPYLRHQNFEALKAALDKVSIKTLSIEQFLTEDDLRSVTKINLSNIFEYMSIEASSNVIEQLSNTLPNGARIALWNMLVERCAPDRAHLRQISVRNPNQPADRFCLYRAFRCYEVQR